MLLFTAYNVLSYSVDVKSCWCANTICWTCFVRANVENYKFLKGLFGILHAAFTVHKGGHMWMKREGWASWYLELHFSLWRIPKPGQYTVIYLYELDVQSSDVQEWVFCTFVQSCPLQHPVVVAMVTYCTEAFTQRHRHFHFRIRKCMLGLQPLSHQNRLRSSDLVVSVPFGLEFPKEQHLSEQNEKGPSSWRTDWRVSVLEVDFCGSECYNLRFIVRDIAIPGRSPLTLLWKQTVVPGIYEAQDTEGN